MRKNIINQCDSMWNNLLFRVSFGFLLLFLAAQVSIPIKPVPITLQTLAVMIIILRFNSTDSFYIILAYLLAGSFGLPVFANFNGGYQYIIQPTGGYLLGFLAAALVMSMINQKIKNNTSYIYTILNCSLGTMIIYFMGTVHLAAFIGFQQAIFSGFLLFIIPEIIKTILLAIALSYLDK